MITYNELCDIAEKDDILMLSGKLHHNVPSIAICDNGWYAVVFDYDQIQTKATLITCTAHEMGHCETGAFYTEHSLELRSRMEYRANKWAIKKLAPKDEMITAMKDGNTEIWQLAEYFGITEDMVKFAMWVYFDKQID